MASIFVVMGTMIEPHRVWPVFWSVDEADCKRVIDACNAQMKQLLDDLQPIWNEMEHTPFPSRFKRASPIYGGGRNHNFDNDVTTYKRAREKLEAKEHDIQRHYADVMLDALFPTGNDGWLPEVRYVLWRVHEDLRNDLKPSELLLLRARLHASETADTLPPDENA
jgi:hypothetical protein